MKKTAQKPSFPLQKKFYTDFSHSRINYSSVLEFKNGVYQGDLLDYRRQGKGIFFWDIGQIYIGDWVDDMITGFGIVFFPFGGHAFGTFLRNKFQGLGVLTFSNGDIYAGKWENGRLEGEYFSQRKGIWSIKKMGVIRNGKADSTPEMQKKIQREFLLFKKEIVEKIPKEFVFQEVYENIPIIVNYSKESNESGKGRIGFLNLDPKSSGLWFYGMLKNGKAEGLGLLFEKRVLRCKGIFQEGKLEGLGTQISNLGDIYDGIFVDGELFVGVVYDKGRNNFVFGQFFKKSLQKIFSEGQGFPFHLLPLYRHNLYEINLSYYYKYTSSELLVLNEDDRKKLYNLVNFSPAKALFKLGAKSLKVEKEELVKMYKDQDNNENTQEHLLTFGNEENPEKNEKEAEFLGRDTSENTNYFVFFQDDGQPFEPNFNRLKNRNSFHSYLKKTQISPNSSEKSIKSNKSDERAQKKDQIPQENVIEKSVSPSSIDRSKDFTYPRMLKSTEQKLKKRWNENDKLLRRNRSLEKLNVMVDDSQFLNKFQKLFIESNLNDREEWIVEEEEPPVGGVHDFSEEVFVKKSGHKNRLLGGSFCDQF